MSASYLSQSSSDISFDWGRAGVEHLSASADAIVIVDVLSFSTAVDIALARGAHVYPYRFKDVSASEYARSIGAELASFERSTIGAYSLSPHSLLEIPSGTRLVLPSPNGSELSLAQDRVPVFTACLRNAHAVGSFLRERYRRIAVIAAGERWPDGSLRPAIEDLIGAGAVIEELEGVLSAEASVARTVYREFLKQDACMQLRSCVSGQELTQRGFGRDVELAAVVRGSRAVPMLDASGCFVDASTVVQV